MFFFQCECRRAFSRGCRCSRVAPNLPRIESSSGAQPSQCGGPCTIAQKGKNVSTHAIASTQDRFLALIVAFKSVKFSQPLRGLSFLILLLALAAHAQDKSADPSAKADTAPKDVRLTIVVTGGEDKKPVDSASVYIRYVEEHKHGRDKKIEMNLKTNQSGICHVPVLPPGKFIVQVIADGWKTYGEYYDINQTEQTINIALVRPPKWY